MSTMPLLLQIALACLLGGVMSVFAASLVMFGLPRRFLGLAVSFSIGLLLSTAMLNLLPEALESGMAPREVFPILLGGILGFFALEKFAIWRHAHNGAGDIDGHEGDRACEDRLQEETKATIRCLPFDQRKEPGKCLLCGKPSSERVLMAKAY